MLKPLYTESTFVCSDTCTDVGCTDIGSVFVNMTMIICASVAFITVLVQESALAGRQVLVGYPGWMDSHGMPWPDRNRDLMDLFKGKASLRASLLKYNITHITVDWAEVRRDSVNIRRLNAHAYRVASNGRWVLVSLCRPLLIPPGERAAYTYLVVVLCQYVLVWRMNFAVTRPTCLKASTIVLFVMTLS